MKTADSVPIDQFSLSEKLALMDRLWEDLVRSPEQLPSPDWHGDVLARRLEALDEGKISFCDWDEAKKRLYERFQ